MTSRKGATQCQTAEPLPMLKSVELMSKISGIGENKLRELINAGKIEFVQTGNKKLLVDSAIWDWYNREKTIAKEDEPCLSE